MWPREHAQPLQGTSFRRHRHGAKIKNLAGDDFCDFPGKVFGPFRCLEHFLIRNFYYEPHTSPQC
jgi:hypothetical protein